LLQRAGFDRVAEIAGGIVGWESANLSVQTAPAP
jgi:rhodanese-related sulfurtransferase